MKSRDEIIRRVYEYAYGIDTRDFDLYRSIFTDDIVTDFSSYRGDEGGLQHFSADGWVARVKTLMVGLDATQHTMTNPLVEIDGNTARCRMYMQAAHFLTDDPDPEYTIGGFYDDRLVRTDAGWRINEVVLTVWWHRGNPQIMVEAARRGREALGLD